MLKFEKVFVWINFGPSPKSCGEHYECKSEVNMLHKILDKAIKKSKRNLVINSITIEFN